MTTSVITFDVEGEPKAQPRARAGKGGHFFNPSKVDRKGNSVAIWKDRVKVAARDVRPREPLEGPLRLTIRLYFERPEAFDAAGQDGAIWHIAKPDVDNCAKAIMDALTDVGFWHDDRQICSSSVEKFYHAKGERSGASIEVASLN